MNVQADVQGEVGCLAAVEPERSAGRNTAPAQSNYMQPQSITSMAYLACIQLSRGIHTIVAALDVYTGETTQIS